MRSKDMHAFAPLARLLLVVGLLALCIGVYSVASHWSSDSEVIRCKADFSVDGSALAMTDIDARLFYNDALVDTKVKKSSDGVEFRLRQGDVHKGRYAVSFRLPATRFGKGRKDDVVVSVFFYQLQSTEEIEMSLYCPFTYEDGHVVCEGNVSYREVSAWGEIVEEKKAFKEKARNQIHILLGNE